MVESLRRFSLDGVAEIASSPFSGSSFWLYAATAILTVIGLILTIRNETSQARGLDRLISFGRMFLAVPLAIFGMQHFVFLNDVTHGVPSWMPDHLFWACFVGAALIAACLSLITGVQAELAALLLGSMFFLFVLLIYLPNVLRNPQDRFAVALFFRDLALSGGAFALAGTLAAKSRPRAARWLVVLGRFFFAVPMTFFGLEHFLHPDFAPGVPLAQMMPPWMPGHVIWAYLTGTALIVCGVSILVERGGRWAATGLGVTFVVLVVFIYVPMEILHPSIVISGELDYVADTLAISGAALLVAGAFGVSEVVVWPHAKP
jgi:uncharacterized membrane protein